MESLHPKTIWLFFFGALFRGLILVIFSSFWLVPFLTIILSIGHQEGEAVSTIFSIFIGWIGFVFLYIVLCFIWAKLAYQNWKYELTEDAFRKESGVIWKSYISIPYERIQNVDIYRGVFARILGLSDLQIQTAGNSAVFYGRGQIGGVGAEGRLPGLGIDVANTLRDELIKRSKSHRPSV